MSIVKSPSEHNRTIHYAHSAAVSTDDILLVNGRVLIAYADLAADEEGMYFIIADEVEAPKAAVAIAAGDAAYWDNGASNFTNVVGTNTKCGMFRKAAVGGDANGNLRLDNTVNV